MDGQNFQNGQNNQTVGTTENTYTGSYQDNTQYTSSSYTDNTQYTSSTYTEPASSTVYNGGTAPAQSTTPGLAIASLVMGIVSILLTCCCGCGIIFAIAGIIMAVVGNKQAKSGVGTAGLICSIVGAVFNSIALVYYILVYIGVLAESGMSSYY